MSSARGRQPAFRGDLTRAALFSVAMHAVLCFPWLSKGEHGEPRADVLQGVSSLELTLVEAPAPRMPDPTAPSAARAPQEPARFEQGARQERARALFENPAPLYPWTARLRGWEGMVVVQAQVSPEGLPRGARVAVSSGHPELDEAALSAVRRWRFLPARRGGRTVASSVEVPIRFRLKE